MLILARGKVALLRQKLGNDDYDSQELASAILHAEAMVRVARKRMKHFSEEERVEREQRDPIEELEESSETLPAALMDMEESGAQDETGELRNESRRIERETAREMARLQQQLMAEVMEETLSEAMEETLQDAMEIFDETGPEDLELLKKKHRTKEMREIMEADMKYLKALFDRLAREKQSGGLSGFSGGKEADAAAVSLELGGTDVPVEAAAPVDAAVGGNVDMAI